MNWTIDALRFFNAIAIVGTISSTIYLLLVLVAAMRFRVRQRRIASVSGNIPERHVVLMKPVHGAEPRLDVNFASFFRQNYSNYEIIFCARHATDPAFKVVDKVSARFPRVKVTKLASGEPPWINPRTYSMQVMLEAAPDSLLIITDSDVEVDPNFVPAIVRHFEDANVGLVTCLYRGVATAGIWSRLEALTMSVDISSGVLVAEMLEGMKFSLGPCIATTKRVIAAAGGLESISEYYADDFVLGNRVSKAGFKVVLSDYIINHIVTNGAFISSLRHQLGWIRSTRFSRAKGHLGTLLTYATPFAILGFVTELGVGNRALALAFLAWGIANRIIQSVAVGGCVVRDRQAIAGCLLYPVRDFLTFCFWIWSYLGNKVRYRGEIYRIFDDGKIRLHQHRRHKSTYVIGTDERSA